MCGECSERGLVVLSEIEGGLDFSIFPQQVRSYNISDRICELVAEQVDAAAAARLRPSGQPAVERVEISGFHGCHHFMAAANAARILHEKGVVAEVVIRRAGNQHVPTFDVDEDRDTFNAFSAALPRTGNWDGQVRRVPDSSLLLA